ncbi:MAG: sulfite exporter TauE/SafE family protein, partial [Acetobacteraceae bacterium]|nr:sulfite exporter TauE/SafE family protein [Acetobacteraceae bacterium]
MTWNLIALTGALAGAGAASGFLAGLFGVGGGSIVVAALYQAFTYAGLSDELCMRMSLGTAFAIMVPTSAASFLGHLRRGSADAQVARQWILPVAAGVGAGSLIASRLESGPLKAIFVTLVLANAFKLLSGWPAWRAAADVPSAAAVRISGLVIGFLSSLIGIGGGVFGNMFLTAYGRSMHQAIGTTASLGAIISLAGTCTFVLLGLGTSGTPAGSLGFVSVVAFCVVAPLAACVAPLGVRLAHRFTKQQLRVGFGLFLVVISAR